MKYTCLYIFNSTYFGMYQDRYIRTCFYIHDIQPEGRGAD